MWRWIIDRGIRGMEERLGVELPYLWHIRDVSPGTLGPLALFLPLVGHGKRVPKDLMHLARIGATLVQDCGECLQIAVNVAAQEGVSRSVVEAGVRGDLEKLSDVQAAALKFGQSVSSGMDGAEHRDVLLAAVGEGGVVELATAVASSQVFPVLKRGLGMARACRLDEVRYQAA